jgi:hypothetical protein
VYFLLMFAAEIDANQLAGDPPLQAVQDAIAALA